MQDLKEIQIEIKKELGGASLNHLLSYANVNNLFLIDGFDNNANYEITFYLKDDEIFDQCYKLLNEQNQALNIFGQLEEFQRNLYKAIQVIKNINNN
jgi:hypothetical protein